MLMNGKIYCKVVESWAFRLLLQFQPHLTCVECCEVLLLHLMHEVFMLEIDSWYVPVPHLPT